MPATAFRRLGYIGGAKQASQGTGVVPTYFWKFLKHAVLPDQKISSYRDGNVRDLTFELKEILKWGGSFQTFFYANEGAALLCWAMGDDAITGAGDPYTHTLTLTDALPWLSIELGMYQDSAAAYQLVDRVVDAKINKLTIEGEASKPLLLTPDIIGLTSAKQGAAATVTFSDGAGQGPMTFLQSVFTITGPTDAATLAGQVQKFKLDLDQKLWFIPGPNSLVPIGLLEQGREVGLTFDAVFSGPTIYLLTYYGATGGTAPAAALGAGSFDVKATCQAAPEHSAQITAGALNFHVAKLEIAPDGNVAMAQITAQPLKSGATMPLAAVVKNAKATAYDV